MTVQSDISNVMRAVGSSNFAYHTFGAAVDRLPRKVGGIERLDAEASVARRPNEPEVQTVVEGHIMPSMPAVESLGIAPNNDVTQANRENQNNSAYVDATARGAAPSIPLSASRDVSLKHLFELISR